MDRARGLKDGREEGRRGKIKGGRVIEREKGMTKTGDRDRCTDRLGNRE